MSSNLTLPTKIEVANMLLRKGSLFVHLDPRTANVVVPPWLRHQAQLVLQVGFDMPIPINDLTVSTRGIFGTLSFSRNPFTCDVPWDAVFALVGDEGRGMVWPESMPAEIAAEVAREEEAQRLQAPKPAIPPLPPAARASGPYSQSAEGSKTQGGKKRRALPPWLRVVK